ncbi:hypothetical protein B0181_02695 [Moraxella caviae]|nr:hypothetical protein B0181_02695 [Moraxella caviae]
MRFTAKKSLICGALFTSAGLLSACGDTKADTTPTLDNAQIAKLIPSRVKQRQSWADDIAKVFDELKLHKDVQNICTAIAVIDQESNFAADPQVAGLGRASLAAIDEKLAEKFGDNLAKIFRTMLETRPSTDNSFIKQIQKVKTERELDLLFQEIFDYFTSTYKVAGLAQIAKLTGEGIDERINPITTLGSMQVHIDYARSHRRQNMSDRALREDLYSQYGGLYYGIHRLMKYEAKYDNPLYRFADYNSGVYSSRNAAFQQRIITLGGTKISIDGDLLLYKDGRALGKKSETETALIRLLATAPTPVDSKQIRSDLRKEKTARFEETITYRTVSEMFKQKTGREASYAIMPKVVISGPKLSRDYDTNWFATRVNNRYETCLSTAKKAKLPLK